MLVELIKSYLDALYGVTSFELKVSTKRILLNLFAILFSFFGLIGLFTLEPQSNFLDALPFWILLAIGVVLFIFSDRVEDS